VSLHYLEKVKFRTRIWIIEEVVQSLRGNLEGSILVMEYMPKKGTIGPQLFLFLSFLLPNHKMKDFALSHAPHIMHCHKPKQLGQP
jgi:hypothetical protein